MKGIMMLSAVVLGLGWTSVSSAKSLFGSAGNDRCGVGTMIFGSSQSVCSQVNEQSTNMFSGNAFSITSGTSGCSNSGFVKATDQEKHFANANHEEIMIEMAAGSGETLEGFAHALGCSDVQGFSGFSQSNYGEIFTHPGISPMEMLSNVKSKLQTQPALGCNS